MYFINLNYELRHGTDVIKNDVHIFLLVKKADITIAKTIANMKLLNTWANNSTDLLVDWLMYGIVLLWEVIKELVILHTHYNSNTSTEETWPS